MSRLVGTVATHVVRQHRRVHGGLARMGAMIDEVAAGRDEARPAVVRRAVRFMDREVLAHADVEDALLAAVCRRGGCRTSAARLGPSHDTLRDVAARLRESPASSTPRADDLGILLGLRDLLRAHLDDEWHGLVPVLADLDPAVADEIHDRFLLSDGRAGAGAGIRAWLATDLAAVTQALSPGSRQWQQPVIATMRQAVDRAARRLAVPLAGAVRGLTVELVPVVLGERITLLVGRMRSNEIETVLAPVDFELALVRARPDATSLEMRHTLVPSRALPADAPARTLTDAAIHAMVGELARWGGRETA